MNTILHTPDIQRADTSAKPGNPYYYVNTPQRLYNRPQGDFILVTDLFLRTFHYTHSIYPDRFITLEDLLKNMWVMSPSYTMPMKDVAQTMEEFNPLLPQVNSFIERLYAANEDYPILLNGEFKRVGLSAGYDLCATNTVTLQPHSGSLIPVDARIRILSANVAGILKMRSSFGLKGLTIPSGVIDTDFELPLNPFVFNMTNEPFTIVRGDYFAQIIFIPLTHNVLFTSDLWPLPSTRSNGLGSTTANTPKNYEI